MKKKTYPPTEKIPSVNEPEAVYEARSTIDKWNPNKPFHGTQEEWWAHFKEIEKGEFTPVAETHQRISEWLKKQSR